MLLDSIRKEIEYEAAMLIKDTEAQAREEADKAREIITLAISVVQLTMAETAVSVVELPNDEMKGRIIGREGRNIQPGNLNW